MSLTTQAKELSIDCNNADQYGHATNYISKVHLEASIKDVNSAPFIQALIVNDKPQQGIRVVRAQYGELGTSFGLDLRFDPNDPNYVNHSTGKPQPLKNYKNVQFEVKHCDNSFAATGIANTLRVPDDIQNPIWEGYSQGFEHIGFLSCTCSLR